jgi:TPR repeat protein
MQDGSVTTELPVGEHSYLVTADGYEPVNGSVVLNVGTPAKIRFDLIQSSIHQLTPEQMFTQSIDYLNGTNGKKRDIVKGLTLLQLAAEKGLPDAQFQMGLIRSEVNNEEQARYWYQKAANQGHANAQFILGLSYANEKDYKQAVSWFRKAANQGHADAQNELGDCYALGYGVEESTSQAIYWYQKAAAQGQADAKEALKIIMSESK